MFLDIVYLVAGLAAVTFGASWLTEGAASVAKRLGVTEFMIGMTIVAVGTSLPEYVVSVTAAISGSADLSVGNIVGSNICNIFLILGVTALVTPIPLTRANIRIDTPITIAVSLLFAILALDSIYCSNPNTISRFDGALLLLLYVGFIVYMIKSSKEGKAEESSKPMPTYKAITLIILGLTALIGGGKGFVIGASAIARALEISDAVIGITVVAVGTSLPELATSVVAAKKGKSAMAIGNIMGSNIANILLIMGTSALISPLSLTDITIIDMTVMTLAPILLLAAGIFIGRRMITRLEGTIFLVIYILYTISLVF